MTLPNSYIKTITDFLSTDILYWNYMPSNKPLTVYVLKGKIMTGKRAIYIPCRYKNKTLQLKNWP